MGSFVDDTAVTLVDGRLTANLSRDGNIWSEDGRLLASGSSTLLHVAGR